MNPIQNPRKGIGRSSCMATLLKIGGISCNLLTNNNLNWIINPQNMTITCIISTIKNMQLNRRAMCTWILNWKLWLDNIYSSTNYVGKWMWISSEHPILSPNSDLYLLIMSNSRQSSNIQQRRRSHLKMKLARRLQPPDEATVVMTTTFGLGMLEINHGFVGFVSTFEHDQVAVVASE